MSLLDELSAKVESDLDREVADELERLLEELSEGKDGDAGNGGARR